MPIPLLLGPPLSSIPLAGLPDLITLNYALSALAIAPLTAAQTAFVPTAITAASNAIRRWCNDNPFTQQTLVEDLPVALNGYVRTSQVPVNQILRCQAAPEIALSIVNGLAQSAQVIFTTTGDVDSGQTITGIKLNWTTNGIPATQSITYSLNETISSLAAAINAVGSGWSATVDTGYEQWAVTELFGGLTGQGAALGAIANFNVYSQDLSGTTFHPDDGQRTGLIWVGQRPSQFAYRWGPFPLYSDLESNDETIIRLTYNAGYATIPAIVQLATVETVRVMLLRLRINPYVMSESAGERSYSLAWQALQALPAYVRQELSAYRIANA